LSIVLLAILAVMGAAFLLPLVVPGQRGHAGDDGWRPAPGSDHAGSRRRPTARQRARGAAALRRRRVLLALTIAVGAAVRAWYLLGGRWWIAWAVTGTLLLAYLGALVVLGWRRHRPAHPAGGERPARRRRRLVRGPAERTELPLWSAPLLEGQASSRRE